MKHIFTKTIDIQGLKRGISFGLGFILTLATSALIAVSVTGTINSFTSGGVVDATQINTNFTSLKTAVEGITSSQWTTSGSNITYSAGNVGIGTSSPGAVLDIAKNISGQADALYVRNTSTAQTDSAAIGFVNTFAVLAKIRGYNGDTNNNSGAFEFQTRNGGTGLYDSIMTIRYSSVGIGTTSPTANLHVVGTTLATVWSTSDERYKKNIQPVSNAMDKILKLRGVNYDWRQDEFKDMKFKSGKDVGFIGQEVERVLPEVVNKDSKGYLSVNYSNILPVLVEAFKEYKSGNDTRVSELKSENDKLSLRLRRATDELAKANERLAIIERSVTLSLSKGRNVANEQVKTLTETVKTQAQASQRMEELVQKLNQRLQTLETVQTANAGKR